MSKWDRPSKGLKVNLSEKQRWGCKQNACCLLHRPGRRVRHSEWSKGSPRRHMAMQSSPSLWATYSHALPSHNYNKVNMYVTM